MLGPILFLVLASGAATTSFDNSFVITSQDVLNGLANNLGTAGLKYQVYGVYASSAPDDSYAKKVWIDGQKGGTLERVSVGDLSTVVYTPYSPMYVEMVAPLKISDTNPAMTQYERVPYTIYIVLSSVNQNLVLSTQLMKSGQIDTGFSIWKDLSVTILNAEPNFLVKNLRMGNGTDATVYVAPVGYDTPVDKYIMMSLAPSVTENSIMITEPIITLRNSKNEKVNYLFSIEKSSSVWSQSVNPGASFTFQSAGWLDSKSSYVLTKPIDEARSRTYDFPRDTLVGFVPMVSDVKTGEEVNVTCTRADGGSNVYKFEADSNDGNKREDWCKTISLSAISSNRPDHSPRFMIQFTSTTSAIGYSLLLTVILALLSH